VGSVIDVRARSLVERSLGLGPGAGDRRSLARRLCGLARVVLNEGDCALATELATQSAAICRAHHDHRGLASALIVLGLASYRDDDPAGGDARMWEALAVGGAVPGTAVTAHTSFYLAYGASRAGDGDTARLHLGRGIAALRAAGAVADEPDWLWAGALVAASEGRARPALRLAGAADALGRRRTGHLRRHAAAALAPWLDGARRELGPATVERLTAEGARLPAEVLMSEMLAEPDDRVDPLSPREREVVGLVAEGLTNGKIAEALFISKRTVESHLDHVKQKLGHGSRHELLAWALRRSLEPQES
jgi:DNA-binding CsgD family transcriptional regulator